MQCREQSPLRGDFSFRVQLEFLKINLYPRLFPRCTPFIAAYVQELQSCVKELNLLDDFDEPDAEVQRVRLICDIAMFCCITNELNLSEDSVMQVKNNKHYQFL